MPYIGWNDKYSVGVDVFDEEHKQLINYINKLHIGMKSGDGISSMGFLLDGLVDYTIRHFSHEENYMLKYSYPDYKKHKSEHALFIGKVQQFKEDFSAGRKAFSLELMGFLKDWLINHILGTDMLMRPFFAGKTIV